MVDPIIVASGISLVRLLLTAAVGVAETNNIPPEQVDGVFAEIVAERKKKKASILPDV